jgi:hypothetical protein
MHAAGRSGILAQFPPTKEVRQMTERELTVLAPFAQKLG